MENLQKLSTPMHGIDICEYNTTISSVKKAGYDFIIHRGGITSQVISDHKSKRIDGGFEKAYQEAKQLNFPFGVYWFSCATNRQEGINEAEYFYTHALQGKTFDFPIFIDIEDGSYQTSCSENDLAAAIRGFCETIESKPEQFIAGIYIGRHFPSDNFLKRQNLNEYPIWFAAYPTDYGHSYNGYNDVFELYYSYYKLDTIFGDLEIDDQIIMWQYTGDLVDPTLGKIDQDYCYYDYPRYIQSNGLNGYEPQDNPPKIFDPTSIFKINNYLTYPFKFFYGDKIEQNAINDIFYDNENNTNISISFDKIEFNYNDEGIFYCPCNEFTLKDIIQKNNTYTFVFLSESESSPITLVNESLNIYLYVSNLTAADYIYYPVIDETTNKAIGKKLLIQDIEAHREEILNASTYFRDQPIFELGANSEKTYYISITRLSKTKILLNKAFYIDLDFTVINNENNFSLQKLPVPGVYSNIPLYYYYHNIETPDTMLNDLFTAWNVLFSPTLATVSLDVVSLYNKLITENPSLKNKIYIYSNRQKIIYPNKNYFIIYKNYYSLNNRITIENSLTDAYNYCLLLNNFDDNFLIYNNYNKLIDIVKIVKNNNEENILKHLLYSIYPKNFELNFSSNIDPLVTNANFIDLQKYWKNNCSYQYVIGILETQNENIIFKQIFPSPYKYRIVLQEKVMPNSIFDLEYPIIPNGQENEEGLFERAKLTCNSYGSNWCVIDNKNNILYTSYDFFNVDDIVGIQKPLLEQDESIMQLDYMKDNLKILKKCWNTDNIINILNDLNSVFINNPNGKMIVTEINNSNEFDYQTATIRYENISNTNLPTIFPLNILYTITSSYAPVDINDTWRIKPYLIYLFKNEQKINKNKISLSSISNNLIPVTYFNRIIKILDENNRPITKIITDGDNEIEICKVRICVPKNFDCHLNDQIDQEWVKTNLIGWTYSSYLF